MATVNILGAEHKGQTVSQLLITQQHMMKTSKFYIIKETQPEYEKFKITPNFYGTSLCTRESYAVVVVVLLYSFRSCEADRF